MTILKYKTIGNGSKAVIFLHELMGDCRNYEAIIPYLDTNSFKYYFVDLRAYGLSKHIKGSYTLNESTNDIMNLITHLNLSSVSLVAHSMSTMIAQKLALIDNRINKLVLVTPVPACGLQMAQGAKDKLIYNMGKNDGMLENIVNDSSKRYNNSWKDYRINIAHSSSILEARVGYMKMYLYNDFINEIENIKIPVRVIVGKYDFPIFSKKSIEKLFNPYYKDIKTIECQEAGHYPMIECPIFFASKLEMFLLEN